MKTDEKKYVAGQKTEQKTGQPTAPVQEKTEQPTMPVQPTEQATETPAPIVVPQPATYKREATPDLVERAMSGADRVYGRLNSGKSPQLISELYLKNNPQPTLPEQDIATQKRRVDLAILSEALRLISDTAAGAYGGNIYKRQPYALQQVAQADNNIDRIKATYAANLRNWQNAYANALKDSGDNKGDYASIFNKIYGGILEQEKQDNINQRFYDKLDWSDMNRKDQQAHQIFLQKLKGTQQERLAQLAAFYRERARNSRDNELVNMYFPKVGWTKMRAIDAKYVPNMLSAIAYQHGGFLPTEIDEETGRIVVPSKYEQGAAQAKALSEGQGNINLQNAISTYPLNGGKQTFFGTSNTNTQKNRKDKNF